VVQFVALYKVVIIFNSVDEFPKCDHLNESYWAVLFCDYFNAVEHGSVVVSVDEILKCDHSNESY